MLNILFWMVLIFTTAILFHNKWFADAERARAARVDALLRMKAEAMKKAAAPACKPSRASYFTIKPEEAAPAAGKILFHEVKPRRACEIYNLRGERVA